MSAPATSGTPAAPKTSGAPTVLKFGGSSFTTPAAYEELARSLSARLDTGAGPLAVVVSAMPGETEGLRDRLHQVDPQPSDDRVAGLLTLADTVSAHLLSAALHGIGRRATVLAGHEVGLTTDETFMWARLRHIDPKPLRRALAAHEVVVVPGGQAVDRQGRPTWLGKNSSDLSAVAVAVALGAAQCEIHSDVAGIHSSDPYRVAGTRLLDRVSYSDAALMSRHGAKVLHRRAVRLAECHGVTLVCRLNKAPFASGTVIGAHGSPADAVVLNLRSTVHRYPDHPTADRAHHAFRSDGLDTVRLDERPEVVLIGGYADPGESERRHGLAPGVVAGIPVTAIRGGTPTVHLAEDDDEAVRLAQKLHNNLPAPASDPTGPPAGRRTAGVRS
ncbi:amino acid kinase family protein [Streptomyces sp. NPDC054863]